MEDVLLATFQSELVKLGINGALSVYKGTEYPYLTYEYFENDVTHEDGSTGGELLCEMWTRGTFEELIGIKEQLKKHFKQLFIKVGNNVYYFDYAGSTPEETGDAELKKRQVNITTKYWGA